jgi:hypothetical protein
MVLARLRRVLFIIEDARLFCPTPFDVAGEEDKRELAWEKLLLCDSADVRTSRAVDGARIKSDIAAARLASALMADCDVVNCPSWRRAGEATPVETDDDLDARLRVSKLEPVGESPA